MSAQDPRAHWRSRPAAYRDDSLSLVVYKPKRPGAAGEDGAWRMVFVDPATRARRNRRLRGTRDEVVRAAKRIAADLEKRRAPDWQDRTFRDVAEAYLADPEHTWEPNVRRGQTQKVGVLLDDTLLGAASMAELAWSPATVRRALKQLAARVSDRTGRPFTHGSLKTYRDLVGTVFSWAQHEEMLPPEAAPMKGVGVPQAQAGSKSALARDRHMADPDDGRGLVDPADIPSQAAAEELGQQWFERAPGRPWFRLLSARLAATAGLRWGEQHALRPVDLVWESDEGPYIDVVRKVLVGTDGKPAGFSKPKGGKVRRALLPPHLADDLARRAHEVERSQGPHGLLFPSPMDPARVYTHDSFTTSVRRYAADAGWPVDELGLLVWTWHSLRHAACMWALRDVGLEPALVSEAVGHSSVAFTQERYMGTSSDSRVRGWEQMKRWSEGS